MMGSEAFPRLSATNHRATSPATPEYNCVAWAAGDTQHWWQPGVYWPLPVAMDDFGIEGLVRAFQQLGFEECSLAIPETGWEKVALYGSKAMYTHAARQLSSGRWTSKLGRDIDIEHDSADDVAGGVYGEVLRLMRRQLAVI
jgi:hypothetical protein